MNTRARQLLMILAGVVVGGAATSALKAQSTPVAYYIAQIDVTGNAGLPDVSSG
jgi:hypothetical protein